MLVGVLGRGAWVPRREPWRRGFQFLEEGQGFEYQRKGHG